MSRIVIPFRSPKVQLFLLVSAVFVVFILFRTDLNNSANNFFAAQRDNLNGFVLQRPNNVSSAEESLFVGFNNVTGAGKFIVPNIIHFIRYNKFELNFIDYVVLLAAMLNHKPEQFYFHTNIPNANFTGKYWEMVMSNSELASRIKVLHLEAPTEIFGQALSTGWRFHHGSDIGRIRVLMKYGGIYLDNDVYVINPLDKYRKFEFVINWDENQFMGTQVIVAHKDARFLSEWLDCYKVYRSDLWYYNAGERPTTEVLFKKPELIHRVKGAFGAATGTSLQLYTNVNFNWRELDAIHLLINHRSYLDPHYKEYPAFNETVVRNYTYPFGDMARDVLDSTAKFS